MILVTGGGGFIGSQVCQLLSSHDQSVIAMDRTFRDNLTCSSVKGDLDNPNFLNELFKTYSFTAIIHLAGVLNTASRQHPEDSMRVNIGGSLKLLRLAAQYKVPKFIFGSSITVYGPKPFSKYGEVTEIEPASPDNIYGVSKRFVEIFGEQYRQQGLLQFTAVRISMVVGPETMNTSSAWRSKIFSELQAKEPTQLQIPFAPHEILPLIHVTEVAEIMERILLANQVKQIFYNTPSENWNCNDLAEILQELNPNLDISFGPASPRGDPEAISGNRFQEEFNFNPVSLQERLRQAAA
jgi:nucleoside-diphosphate-sugar epimerase